MGTSAKLLELVCCGSGEAALDERRQSHANASPSHTEGSTKDTEGSLREYKNDLEYLEDSFKLLIILLR